MSCVGKIPGIQDFKAIYKNMCKISSNSQKHKHFSKKTLQTQHKENPYRSWSQCYYSATPSASHGIEHCRVWQNLVIYNLEPLLPALCWLFAWRRSSLARQAKFMSFSDFCYLSPCLGHVIHARRLLNAAFFLWHARFRENQ